MVLIKVIIVPFLLNGCQSSTEPLTIFSLGSEQEGEWLTGVEYSMSGELLSTSTDGSSRSTYVMDAESGEKILEMSDVGYGRYGIPPPFTGDDKYLLMPDFHRFQLTDIGNGSSRQVMVGNPLFEITSVSHMNQSGFFVTSDSSGTIRIWNPQGEYPVQEFAPVEPSAQCSTIVDITSDDSSIIAGGCDGVIRIWDAETGALKDKFGEFDNILDLEISPDDRFLAVLDLIFNVHVLNFETRQEIALIDDFKLLDRFDVPVFAVDPNGGKLATYPHRNRQIKIWNVLDSQIVECSSITVGGAPVLDIAYSPDGNEIAVVFGDQLKLVSDNCSN